MSRFTAANTGGAYGARPLLAVPAVLACLALFVVLAFPDGAGAGRTVHAERSFMPRGLHPAITRGAGRARVAVMLTDNGLLAMRTRRAELSGRMPESAAARVAARGSRGRRSDTERAAAGALDERRNTALADIRRAARSGSRQSARVTRWIERAGGRVVAASPLPNSLTAIVPRSRLAELAALRGVAAVTPARRPVPMSSSIDGSGTWHANGFTGGGNGGPDVVVFDMGVRTSHIAFRTRMPGDPADGPGSGETRVYSPAGRTVNTGSSHGNAIAATIASTNFSSPLGCGGWPCLKGQAYGLDKLYDPYFAKHPSRWALGIAYGGEPGVPDLPEVTNYSAGVYEDNVDANPIWLSVDAEVDQLGITQTVSAGNCGVVSTAYTNCYNGPHRISSPSNLYNVIAVGGVVENNPYDPSTWTVWQHSSPGPTYGGRKKPDLISSPFTSAGGPVAYDDYEYGNAGSGTSFAAPEAASAATLLASSGVYAPTAQRAILINTARPIQGQTQWHPRSGWGALNMDGAFYDRGNYQNGAVPAVGANGVRFFRQTGVAVGDRTTLVWNRRTVNSIISYGLMYATLTNLDLFQIDPADGAITATGGVDAADTVDTDQTPSADNPMPGNGADGGDNVEQVRSTAAGTQIYKVKAMSPVDGAAAEPFSIAGSNPVEALSTPVPEVTLSIGNSPAGPGNPVVVTASVTNPSDDLPLAGAFVTLGVPADVGIVGSPTRPIGTLAQGATSVKQWMVTSTADGLKNLSATATGTVYGEGLNGSDAAAFTIDATPPVVQTATMPRWSADATPVFSWSATDDRTSVTGFDAEMAHGEGAFIPLLYASPATSTSFVGREGERLRLRVRARDALGNRSDWQEMETTIDAEPPAVTIGDAVFTSRASISVPVSVTNLGSAATARYRFGDFGGHQVFGGGSVKYANYSLRQVRQTLRVTATDALGRDVTAQRSFTVPSRYLSPRLRIVAGKGNGDGVVVRGSVVRGYKSRITVTARRVGRKGTERLTRSVRPRNGRFRLRLRLKPGRYAIRASAPHSGTFVAASVARSLVVK